MSAQPHGESSKKRLGLVDSFLSTRKMLNCYVLVLVINSRRLRRSDSEFPFEKSINIPICSASLSLLYRMVSLSKIGKRDADIGGSTFPTTASERFEKSRSETSENWIEGNFDT